MVNTSASSPTWAPYNGRAQAGEIDYIWVWTTQQEGEIRTTTRRSPQERHDHRVLMSTVSAQLLPPVQDLPPLKGKLRLEMDKYPEYEDALQQHLTDFHQGLGEEGDVVTRTDQVLTEAGEWLANTIGTDKPIRQGGGQI